MEDDRLTEIEEDFIDDEEEEEDDYEEGEYEYYEDEDEEDYEEEEIEELIPMELTSPSVSTSIANGNTLQGEVVINDGLPDNLESCDGNPGKQENGGDEGGKEALDRGQIDGLFCPICFEAWTSGGEHQICCLPCGHIYGFSCIKKWLQRNPSSKKCPQCKGLCTLKDVRVLYAARLCVADEELHKRVQDLEEECAYYKQKDLYNEWMIKNELQELRETLAQIKLENRERDLKRIQFEEQIKLENQERDLKQIQFQEQINLGNRERDLKHIQLEEQMAMIRRHYPIPTTNPTTPHQ